MKKLKLDLRDLKVESFTTTANAGPQLGTVFGQNTEDTNCNQNTCFGGDNTCGYADTCAGICGGTTGTGSGPACPTSWVIGWPANTCNASCNCGTTASCTPDIDTNCCNTNTCDGSCTNNGCTGCGEVC